MTGIFISYSRKDSQAAKKLMEGFKSVKLDVWVDWEDIPPAVGWLDQILHGIEQAEVFVFLISPDSIKSEVCKVELEHARKNSKRIIPVVARDVVVQDVTPILRDLNWIFIREQDDFAAGLEKVNLAINLDIEWLQEHRRLQVRALEWDRKKESSLLLRGTDLRNARKMIVANEKKDPFPSPLQKLYIESSRRGEQLRLTTYVSAAVTLFIMVFLSLVALNQRQEA
ncbi:MAG TPA: toll/interleukin-1 receptor domain-containing protein, partial [Anaerolineales bacterium]|nr:toll/interleukin-1 receptor domain-containing protein [Anaerolineales bacterium]